MHIRDLLYLSVKNFQNRKSRVILTALGVAIAISAVLFLVSLGYGLQRILLEKITTTESLLSIDIIPSDPSIRLNEDKIKEILSLPNVEKVSAQASVTAAMYKEGVTAQAIVNLVEPDIFQLEGMLPQAGRLFTSDDKNQIVVNTTVAKLFDESPEAIVGKEFLFLFLLPKEKESAEIETVQMEQPFTVAGVVEKGDSSGEVFMNRVDAPDVQISEYQFAKVQANGRHADLPAGKRIPRVCPV
ncbi:MAG: ABC transporter permease [Candidatus Wildermuthbacteria bacterium]|nr:ABC transporter permease [Candidatus Wildermuthbacteria bacterium]